MVLYSNGDNKWILILKIVTKKSCWGNLSSTLEIIYCYAQRTNKDAICEYATIKDLIKRINQPNNTLIL